MIDGALELDEWKTVIVIIRMQRGHICINSSYYQHKTHVIFAHGTQNYSLKQQSIHYCPCQRIVSIVQYIIVLTN